MFEQGRRVAALPPLEQARPRRLKTRFRGQADRPRAKNQGQAHFILTD
jgi:hypothetical protein